MAGREVRERLVGVAMPAVVAVAVAAGCSGGTDDSSVGPRETGPTSDLAPSQLTAETAAPPETPPPCEPAAITAWTARTTTFDGWTEAVLRVRNDGDVRCDVDVSRSPLVDPLMEPDVWLDPGAWADLVLSPDDPDCGDPAIVRVAELALGTELVDVATAAVVPCTWWFAAFYPVPVSDSPCDTVDAVVVDGAVLVRNGGAATCRLGELVDVEGDDATLTERGSGSAVPMLAPGDVVALELERDATGSDGRPVGLVFDSGVTIGVEVDGGAVSISGGPPQPWIGGPGSPSADTPDELVAALDPFGADG